MDNLRPADSDVVRIPFTTNDVLLSDKRRWRTSTVRSNCERKSTPIMGDFTSAIKNNHWKRRRSPRSRVIKRSPYVEIVLPLAACNVTCEGFGRCLTSLGITLTSAPVSIRNFRPLDRSKMWNKRLIVEWPATAVVATGWPWSLTFEIYYGMNIVVHIYGHFLQTNGETSTNQNLI